MDELHLCLIQLILQASFVFVLRKPNHQQYVLLIPCSASQIDAVQIQ